MTKNLSELFKFVADGCRALNFDIEPAYVTLDYHDGTLTFWAVKSALAFRATCEFDGGAEPWHCNVEVATSLLKILAMPVSGLNLTDEGLEISISQGDDEASFTVNTVEGKPYKFALGEIADDVESVSDLEPKRIFERFVSEQLALSPDMGYFQNFKASALCVVPGVTSADIMQLVGVLPLIMCMAAYGDVSFYVFPGKEGRGFYVAKLANGSFDCVVPFSVATPDGGLVAQIGGVAEFEDWDVDCDVSVDLLNDVLQLASEDIAIVVDEAKMRIMGGVEAELTITNNNSSTASFRIGTQRLLYALTGVDAHTVANFRVGVQGETAYLCVTTTIGDTAVHFYFLKLKVDGVQRSMFSSAE
jgi:hypothetical protein